VQIRERIAPWQSPECLLRSGNPRLRSGCEHNQPEAVEAAAVAFHDTRLHCRAKLLSDVQTPIRVDQTDQKATPDLDARDHPPGAAHVQHDPVEHRLRTVTAQGIADEMRNTRIAAPVHLAPSAGGQPRP
jgi:hypothetical protein